MTGFVGHYTNRIDAKGRVSVPAPLRAELARDGHDGLFCYPSLDMMAIDAGGNALRAVIDQHLGRYAPFSEDHDFLSTALYGASEKVKIDGDGRITVSDELKDFAGITDQVTFVGQGYKFQIWSPERFADHRKEANRRALLLRKSLNSPIAAPETSRGTE